MAEWSKAPDSSSGPLTRAWVQIPLLTIRHLKRVFCNEKREFASFNMDVYISFSFSFVLRV
ncbi:hypothetical protein I3760_10G091900 [Carya illinoinensis]|uniref:Uncharacterized protein n=1 Tax=Carya illinoinensis TaxID=32201 RepID=A0A922DW77_CARIL|nr:hypothetical protein I3760_10G091900 [Carya illinoinensis]KAG6692023.1 hypothetical protein I3842_10G092100 [Carya illinoinensis]